MKSKRGYQVLPSSRHLHLFLQQRSVGLPLDSMHSSVQWQYQPVPPLLLCQQGACYLGQSNSSLGTSPHRHSGSANHVRPVSSADSFAKRSHRGQMISYATGEQSLSSINWNLLMSSPPNYWARGWAGVVFLSRPRHPAQEPASLTAAWEGKECKSYLGLPSIH